MSQTAMIVAYKGLVYINATIGGKPVTENQECYTLENFAPGLINDPTQQGQLGFIYEAGKVSITQEAVDLLKKVERNADAIGDIDIFGAEEVTTFSFLGGPHLVLDPKIHSGSRDYNPELLDKLNIVESEIDESIIKFGDAYEKEQQG